jgi:membrane protein DedA with SNARE-associated domain/membrane-associated phospholipid phosphatase
MSRVIGFILHLHGGAAYALVFLLPALESSAFVGFLFPGELAIVLGGVLAYQGRASLPIVVASAIAGAILGDSVGYAVGARWGERIFKVRLVRRFVTPERRRKAEELLRRRGATAVLIGRFTAVARVLVPGLSGMAGLKYRRFLFANAVGGILWGGGFTLLGYLAGDAWRKVEHIAARASLLLAILLFVAIAFAVAAQRIAANEDALREWFRGFAQHPGVARFARRYAAQIGFLYRRLDPREALGLYLTIGLALSIGAGWVFGAAAQDILANQQIVIADEPLARFVSAHRSVGFTRLLKTLSLLGHPAVVVGIVACGALLVARRGRSLRPGAFVLACVAGGEVLHRVVGRLVGRPAPLGGLVPAPAFSFPSGHTVIVATLCGAVAFALSLSASWAVRVWMWTAAFALVLVVGLCSIYLAIAHPSDVLGGAALGAAWLAFCATGWRTWERRRRTRGVAEPA